MKTCDIELLEKQGCISTDWSQVTIQEGTDLSRIRNVYFNGKVTIGANPVIINVPGGISNVRIGDNVKIVNVSSISRSQDATFGVGTDIAVLDESGSRPVRIYPGISAQVATIAARMPKYSKDRLLPMISCHIQNLPDMPEIGDNVEICDCGTISDVRIWSGVRVDGAVRLKNGSIVNNTDKERSLTYVGNGVDAENFIIEDATVTGGCIIRNTYVGQGCVLDKGFTSHDSLFFANSCMENGEACAVLAGPYSVSMHKSTLLIGCHTSFMNSGSGTNMSNHMYKLGPVHWGVMERGVKTSSNSYVMHGSRIGAYSLVMGEHKNHPDSSEFPFSYLFGDQKGQTIVVPGAMLKSYGLKRDEGKWHKRDRRLNRGMKIHDRITFEILNPYTADMILNATGLIRHLLGTPTDDEGFITYKGLKIKPSSLKKGLRLYELALCKYINSIKEKEAEGKITIKDNAEERWVDLSCQVISESDLMEILNAGSIEEMEKRLDQASETIDIDVKKWTEFLMQEHIDHDALARLSAELDTIIENDRIEALRLKDMEDNMLSFL